MAAIAAKLGITRETLNVWRRERPEFSDATTRARELALAWWEEQGRLGIWSRDFNANAYRLQVMNRFPADWRDKQEHAHTGRDGEPLEIVRRVVHVTASNRVSEHMAGVNGNGQG